jgi:hypothetical protein
MISPRPQMPQSGTKRTGRSIRWCCDSSPMILVDRYQSVVDTFVQLFSSCPSVVIASLRPDSIGKCTTRKKENEHENTDGVNIPRSIGQHGPQDWLLA